MSEVMVSVDCGTRGDVGVALYFMNVDGRIRVLDMKYLGRRQSRGWRRHVRRAKCQRRKP